jgi:hypothetical protein
MTRIGELPKPPRDSLRAGKSVSVSVCLTWNASPVKRQAGSTFDNWQTDGVHLFKWTSDPNCVLRSDGDKPEVTRFGATSGFKQKIVFDEPWSPFATSMLCIDSALAAADV